MPSIAQDLALYFAFMILATSIVSLPLATICSNVAMTVSS